MSRRRFRRSRDGNIRWDPAPGEAEVLRRLAADLGSLLAGDDAPEEIRTRLYPRAYDDPRLDAEFRRLMATDLEQRKQADLATLQATLRAGDGPVELTPDEVRAWLGALQDMRLALGSLLGIEDDGWEEDFPEDDEHVAVLHWLGYLQDTLISLIGG